MERQMQQRLPAHLQQYIGSNKPTYIPERIQTELTAHLRKATPAHMQQYASAYVQQNVVDPSLRAQHAVRQTVAPPPTPRARNLSRSADVPGEQAQAQFLNLFQPDATGQPAVVKPGDSYAPANGANLQAPAQQSGASSGNQSQYDFIFNSAKPPKAPGFFSSGSMLKRALIFGGGLVLLLLIFSFAMSLISQGGKAKTGPLLAVEQEQTELIRVSTAGSTTATQENARALAYAVQLSISSANNQLNTYVSSNKLKINPKLLGAKYSASTDTELKDAQANSTYDATLVNVLRTDLNEYAQSLKTAYAANPGPKGRQLLSDQFNGSQLLLQQCDTTTSALGH